MIRCVDCGKPVIQKGNFETFERLVKRDRDFADLTGVIYFPGLDLGETRCYYHRKKEAGLFDRSWEEKRKEAENFAGKRGEV